MGARWSRDHVKICALLVLSRFLKKNVHFLLQKGKTDNFRLLLSFLHLVAATRVLNFSRFLLTFELLAFVAAYCPRLRRNLPRAGAGSLILVSMLYNAI